MRKARLRPGVGGRSDQVSSPHLGKARLSVPIAEGAARTRHQYWHSSFTCVDGAMMVVLYILICIR